jgi:tripartite-type tricarboxylate transporter receptor subunit TctC
MAAIALPALAVHAQDYPNKPVRVIVPFPAGGGVDIVARALTPHLTERWNQQVIVDNRPGAGTIVGTELAAKSVPDGYTLLMTNTSHATNGSMYKKLPYETLADFRMITLVATQSNLVVVHPAVPVKSVKDLIALAKAKPNQLNYASAGNGTSPHLAAALFCSMAGVEMTHIPYKGAAPALTDLIGGQIQVSFATILSVWPHVQSGRVRPLAVTSARRSAAVPDLPTVAESGVPGYESTAWFILLAPAKTPQAIADRLNADAVAVLKRPDVRERFAKEGAETVGGTSAQGLEFLRAEIAKWGKVIKTAGIQPE